MVTEIIVAIIAALASAAGAIGTNVANRKNVEDTNATNKELANQANAMQVAESEKAYDRSKATNQVALLRQAGMSPAAAVGALREGGSYTPAPINTAQMQSSQLDNPLASLSELSSNLFSSGSNSRQIENQREQFEKDLQHQKDEAEKQRKQDDQHFRDNLEQQGKAITADVNLKKAQQANAEYDLAMRQLRENEKDYAEYSQLLGKADPVSFDSAYQFVQSVTDGKFVSASIREALVKYWSQANTDANVSATTKKTDQETEFVKKQVEDFGNYLQEWKDCEDVRKKERLANEAEAQFRKLMADMGVSEAELRKSLEFDENGKPNGWKRTSAEADRFWRTLHSYIPFADQLFSGALRMGAAVLFKK